MKTPRPVAPLLGKEFILAGVTTEKYAIFTLQVPPEFSAQYDTKPHYTFKVRHKGKYSFVSVLTGPDNEAHYTYIGCLERESGGFRLTEKSHFTNTAWPVKFIRRVFACLWEVDGASLTKLRAAGFELMHCGKCGMCSRRLTDPISIKRGLGPICAERLK